MTGGDLGLALNPWLCVAVGSILVTSVEEDCFPPTEVLF